MAHSCPGRVRRARPQLAKADTAFQGQADIRWSTDRTLLRRAARPRSASTPTDTTQDPGSRNGCRSRAASIALVGRCGFASRQYMLARTRNLFGNRHDRYWRRPSLTHPDDMGRRRVTASIYGGKIGGRTANRRNNPAISKPFPGCSEANPGPLERMTRSRIAPRFIRAMNCT